MGKCDPSELDALFQKVNDRGWQLASMPKLLSFIEESEEKARSAIALIAYLPYFYRGPPTPEHASDSFGYFDSYLFDRLSARRVPTVHWAIGALLF
jgi:hypothetical protein